jgi:hypothetical protein
MQNRSSSESHWFGYKLYIQEIPKLDNPEADGWEIGILTPNGQPWIGDALVGPFKSVRTAEARAEQIVRALRESKGDETDSDAHPIWEQLTMSRRSIFL